MLNPVFIRLKRDIIIRPILKVKKWAPRSGETEGHLGLQSRGPGLSNVTGP